MYARVGEQRLGIVSFFLELQYSLPKVSPWKALQKHPPPPPLEDNSYFAIHGESALPKKARTEIVILPSSSCAQGAPCKQVTIADPEAVRHAFGASLNR